MQHRNKRDGRYSDTTIFSHADGRERREIDWWDPTLECNSRRRRTVASAVSCSGSGWPASRPKRNHLASQGICTPLSRTVPCWTLKHNAKQVTSGDVAKDSRGSAGTPRCTRSPWLYINARGVGFAHATHSGWRKFRARIANPSPPSISRTWTRSSSVRQSRN